MRICYLADARSGHTKRWIEYFAKDNEVDLITFDYATKDGAFITEKDYIKMGVRVHKIPRKIPNLLLTPVIVRRLIHKIAPDVLHAHYATQYGFCGAFSGFHPFILSVWGSDVTDRSRQIRDSQADGEDGIKECRFGPCRFEGIRGTGF
jgi:hypothetical protein